MPFVCYRVVSKLCYPTFGGSIRRSSIHQTMFQAHWNNGLFVGFDSLYITIIRLQLKYRFFIDFIDFINFIAAENLITLIIRPVLISQNRMNASAPPEKRVWPLGSVPRAVIDPTWPRRVYNKNKVTWYLIRWVSIITIKI